MRIMSHKIKKELELILPGTHYPILIGEGLYSKFETFGIDKGQRVFIVTNCDIASLYLSTLIQTLQSNEVELDYLVLPSGEEGKSLTNWHQILTSLLEKQHNRHSFLFALGGGVVGDLTGFAAATFHRGIRYIQLPTTLLSQVDSSVGGKTGMNHPLGKNMIGAFHQPTRVIIDIATLKTLNQREFSAGLAEVIKYGIILDHHFFSWLERNIEKLLAREPEALVHCIERCCELKTQIIRQDERENGIRAVLNFGHTFGHAIEVLMGYGNWLHGEAVATGMLMAAQASKLVGLLQDVDIQRMQSLIQRAGLPITRPKILASSEYLVAMKHDKKRHSSSIRLVLISSIGQAVIKEIHDEKLLLDAISLV